MADIMSFIGFYWLHFKFLEGVSSYYISISTSVLTILSASIGPWRRVFLCISFYSLLLAISAGCKPQGPANTQAIVLDGSLEERSKSLSEAGSAPQTSNLPNGSNECYTAAITQVIANLYPNLFDNHSDELARAGKCLVQKMRAGTIQENDVELFYKELLELCEFEKGIQQDAQEAISTLLRRYITELYDEEDLLSSLYPSEVPYFQDLEKNYPE